MFHVTKSKSLHGALHFLVNTYHGLNQTVANEQALPSDPKMRCKGLQHICTVLRFTSFVLILTKAQEVSTLMPECKGLAQL